MDNSNRPKIKIPSNPLPYIISFFVLTLIALGVLTWVIGVFYQAHQCVLYPNVWCSDQWTCNQNCNSSSNNSCFNNVGTTGLASCLFGPLASGATLCLNTPAGSSSASTTCSCLSQLATAPNCIANCVQDISEVSSSCCCNQAVNPNCKSC